jgi:hypothetical protein
MAPEGSASASHSVGATDVQRLFSQAVMDTVLATALGGVAGAISANQFHTRPVALAAVRRAVRLDLREQREVARAARSAPGEATQQPQPTLQNNTRDATRAFSRKGAGAAAARSAGAPSLFASVAAPHQQSFLARSMAEVRDMMPTSQPRAGAGTRRGSATLRESLRRVAAESAGRVIGRSAVRHSVVTGLFVGTFSLLDVAFAILKRDAVQMTSDTTPDLERTPSTSVLAGALTGGLFGRRILSGGTTGMATGVFLGAAGAGVVAALRSTHRGLQAALEEARPDGAPVASPETQVVANDGARLSYAAELREELKFAEEIQAVKTRGESLLQKPDSDEKRR